MNIEKNYLHPIRETLEKLYEQYRPETTGEVASYYPELGKANPENFGISFVSINGDKFSFGDAGKEFTTMSCSKPFVYGLALDQHGTEVVQERVGVEPTGDAYNSIIKLDSNNLPHNPMINAGAIVVADMINGASPAERFQNILNMFSAYIGREPGTDMAMFASAKKAGHRNRAIAHLLLGFHEMNKNVDEALELYLQQCCIRITCEDLAMMAATLANRGRNPVTDVPAIQADNIRHVLSIMLTCGLYDYSGEWVYDVGLPAKTGVSGGTFVVIPGIGGLAVYSPLLDKFGNSVRGVKVCEDLSKACGLHIFDLLFDNSRTQK